MTESGATPGEARDASRAADEFRASLERRRESEDVLAEARVARQDAMAEAVEIVRVAEAMARVIEDAARAAADATLAEATARSEQVVAKAREEVARLLVTGDEPVARSTREDFHRQRKVDAARTATEAELDRARRGIQALQETALAEVAAQREHAQAAFHEQIGTTIGRLEAMASEVQMVLDRAMTELTESLAPLSELPVSWVADPPPTNGTLPKPAEAWHERWRSLFRPAR